VPGVLAYLGAGRDGIAIEMRGGGRAVLLGGEPFAEQIVMGWNFVGRSRDEVTQAGADWNAGHERFGTVASALARIPAPGPRL
jgi:redox-sensitive bicupin YhaK (pirin superfamily)